MLQILPLLGKLYDCLAFLKIPSAFPLKFQHLFHKIVKVDVHHFAMKLVIHYTCLVDHDVKKCHLSNT
jgi:hypothetical protein